MLLEIAALNSSFKILQTLLSNGKSLYECGESLTSFFQASSEINKQPSSKSGSGSALESYQAQQEVKKTREALKFAMNKNALCGWADFVQFEAEWYREKRAEEAELLNQQIRKSAQLKQDIQLAINVGVSLMLALGLLFGIAIYYKG